MTSLADQIRTGDGALAFRPAISPTVRLGATGDLAFHGRVLPEVHGDRHGHVFAEVAELIRGCDLAIGNLESVLVARPFSPVSAKAYLISSLDALVDLKDAGFDVLTFANNHILDAGPEGVVECLDGLAAAGLPTAGAGRDAASAREPVRTTVGGIPFVVFAYSYGCGQIAGPGRPGCNESTLAGVLADVRRFAGPDDMKVVCLHMDAEFQETPAPDRIAFCRRLAEAGVQIVLCHHPHVPQGIEMWKGSFIAYSLGNFVFPLMAYLTEASPDCDKSFLLELEVDRQGPVGARLHPIVLDGVGRPVPPDAAGRRDVLEMVAHRSALLADADTVARNYAAMTSAYATDLLKNLYWSVGERDWPRFRLLARSLKLSPTNRRWLRHFLGRRVLGR